MEFDPSVLMVFAAVTGNIETITTIVNDFSTDELRQQLCTLYSNNNILHLASEYGHPEAVQLILSKHPSLLTQLNSNDDTPLHLAARGGHASVMLALIDCAKQHNLIIGRDRTWKGILKLTNKKGDAAIHDATRYNHIQVVAMLLQQDPDACRDLNNFTFEHPLYMAASRGFHDLLDLMINACGSQHTLLGPDGRTPLHGAVICNSQECTAKLLQWDKRLVTLPDWYCRTPLHYAAKLGFGNLARQILSVDTGIAMAYVGIEEKGVKIPLFVAACGGHVSVMKQLIELCTGCCYMVDGKGRNVLHIAIEHEQKDVIEYLFDEYPWLINSLITTKDKDGNTPLHLLATSECFVPKLIHHPLADKGALNNDKLTPLDLVIYDSNSPDLSTPKKEIAEELKRVGGILHLGKDPDILASAPPPAHQPSPVHPPVSAPIHDTTDHRYDEMYAETRKVVENHMVVAALIATVAFTAGFAMPGGYIQSGTTNQGMAVLARNSTAFQAFVISDTMALLFSTSALLSYFISAIFKQQGKEGEAIVAYAAWAMIFNMLGLGAMIVAFITGTYAVLHYSYALAVSTSILASFIFLVHFAILGTVVVFIK